MHKKNPCVEFMASSWVENQRGSRIDSKIKSEKYEKMNMTNSKTQIFIINDKNVFILEQFHYESACWNCEGEPKTSAFWVCN